MEPPDRLPPTTGVDQEEAVLAQIRTVYDPEIPVDIYALGLIYDLVIQGPQVRVVMTLTAPGCPSAQELPLQVQQVVQQLPWVQACTVTVVWDPPWTLERMDEAAKLALNIV